MKSQSYQKKFTVCPRDCYDTCALEVTVSQSGNGISVKGDSRNPITRGFTCPRGISDLKRIHQNRIGRPFRRIHDAYVEKEWDPILNTVCDALRDVLCRYGPESVLYLDFAGNMGILSGIFPERLWNALGATRTDHSLCSASGHAGINLHYGSSHGVFPEDLLTRKLIIFWGFNAAVSSPHLWSLAVRARKLNGAKIIAVDPRKSLTAMHADLHINLYPESDIVLAYGLMNYLIGHDLIDIQFIEQWTNGFEQLKAESQDWALERVGHLTGVSSEMLIRFGKDLGSKSPSLFLIGLGLQKCDFGADKVRAVSLIPALLGNHRGFIYSNSSAFTLDSSIISGRAFSRIPQQVVSQVALSDDVKKGRFKFIFVNCMNPALTLPNQNDFREGISRNDVFLVVHDTHWTRTCEMADVVLPAASYLEKEDLVIPWCHPYIRLSQKALPEYQESKTEIWVMREISRKLNLTEPWLYEDPWKVIRLVLKDAVDETDIETLWTSEKMIRLKCRSEKYFPTPSGKIEFYSFMALNQGLDPLPRHSPSSDYRGAYFTLLTSAVSKFTNTQFQEVFGPIPAIVMMNPIDAEVLDVKENQVVMLVNPMARIMVKAVISDSVPSGVLWSPRQSEDIKGIPQNAMIRSLPQRIGGGPRFNSTHVKVFKPLSIGR
jgi:anaerobic selenocysteine-containing dehydrogenase